MRPIKNLQGLRFGRLVVQAEGTPYLHQEEKYVQKYRRWICRCDCGTETLVRATALTKGHSKSCGCLQRDTVRKQVTKHGLVSSSTYRAWSSMKERCYNPNFIGFPFWGGRGITVCDEWLNDFAAFYAYVGERPPGKSIDRINNDLGYVPGNVRWATASEQAQNKSNTRRFTFNGETKTITQWASQWHISRGALGARLKRGMPFDQIAARMAR